jgi:hypothetical protein
VRGADARCAKIGGPDGISQCFQVRTYSGEPLPSSLARNLLSNDDWRQVLGDEVVEDGPEVSVVIDAELLAGVTEGLAREAGSPDGSIPPCKLAGELPSADPGEEVTSLKPGNVS